MIDGVDDRYLIIQSSMDIFNLNIAGLRSTLFFLPVSLTKFLLCVKTVKYISGGGCDVAHIVSASVTGNLHSGPLKCNGNVCEVRP